MTESIAKEPPNGPKGIEIPRGWNRILEKGSILYISPNNSRLRSLDHVIEYLKTEGTCKCGLECPLYIHKIFNFDARIPSKLVPVGGKSDTTLSSCKHCASSLFETSAASHAESITQLPSKDAKLPSFSTPAKDALGQKRGPGRPRNSTSRSRRTSASKSAIGRPTSPLHNIPLPVPSSVTNSPVQSVPTNIAVNQGPLPSFATIVSSSKLFNPGASLGTTQPCGSGNVTSTVSSCPLTTTPLLSSKLISAAQNVCTSSSASASHTDSSGVPCAASSNVMSPVMTSVTVSNQQSVVVPAQLPSKSKESSRPKERTLADTKTASLPVTSPIVSCVGSTMPPALSDTNTSVVSGKVKAVSPNKQTLKSYSDGSKSTEVKAVPQPVVPQTSKVSKPYGGRKTVAASLKAAALAAKVTTTPVPTKPPVSDTSLQRMHTVANTSTAPPCKTGSVNRTGVVSSQMLPTPSVSTTVQAPALFHNVLKDAIGKDQGQFNQFVAASSTQGQKTTSTPVVTSNIAVLSRGGSSVQTKDRAQEKTQTPVSFVPSVTVSHAAQRAPQHVAAQRPQPAAAGYSVVKSGNSLYGQVPLASSISQQQNVQATTQMPPLAGSIYGQTQNAAGASQVPSLQIASSQTQGGVFVHGNTNQVFQMNVADSNQLKGAFQIHGALYQGTMPTTFFAANKTASPAAGGGVAQAVYSTNPYMLGILMPTAMSQAMTTASVSGTTTAVTSPSVTTAAVSSPTVASYTYNNQNAAIAAAFESFVPIAPAASPRFSQTLAHLASAYTPFVPRGVVQGNTPVQFTQRIVPMGNMPSQACGNGQVGAPVFNLSDYTLKYPINAVKPTSYSTQTSTSTTAASGNAPQQAAVVAAMPYVAFGQINNPRFPFAVNLAAQGVGSNSSSTVSSTSGTGGAVTLATSSSSSPYAAAGGSVDSQAAGAVLGYVAMPFNTNTSGGSLPNSSSFAGSAFVAPSSNSSVSLSGQGGPTPASQHVTWCGLNSSPGAANQRGCNTLEGNSSGCCVSPPSSASVCRPKSRSSCTDSVAGPSSAGTNCCQPGQSPRYSGTPSPLNSPTAFPRPDTPLSVCQSSATNETHRNGKRNVEGIASLSQGYSTSDSYKKKSSPSGTSCPLKRPYGEGSDSKKRTKYDESAYYEANPLLGLKRSCEAIEVGYSEAERDGGGDNVECSRKSPKNEQASPDDNGKSGEGCVNSNNCGNQNNDAETNCVGEAGKKFSEDQTVTSYAEPVTDRHQSHSVYNGDVAASADKELMARVVSNHDSYRSVKTNPMFSIPVERSDSRGGQPMPNTRPRFDIGDIVWAQARGLPSWPGKVVDESEVGKGKPDDGKRWVMWFGDHTCSQVDVDRLKSLSDGLRTLDDKARKKKYRAKKARISLEQAISEALEALEIRERLRARQATRSKAKKKRLR